jgi:hypothetical protein
MRIPKKIKICGQEFTVQYEDNLKDKGQALLGCCKVDGCTIYLKKRMHKNKKKEVFLHECVHAIDENLDLRLGEKKVNILAINILSLIINNNLDFLS